jgi:hypothetical protein
MLDARIEQRVAPHRQQQRLDKVFQGAFRLHAWVQDWQPIPRSQVVSMDSRIV